MLLFLKRQLPRHKDQPLVYL
ncbi:hypothetical protein Golax_012641 [Gossypium laxum]|uniref:Uncharacterized protein n=2 Tax=Gossypium TaxID=3633 RepID=A0A7J8RQA5_GOSDV|nr:hypothetical protein [Gossypium davidsonii]MBA0713616.1 hypothetical protein [Gossypium laxum]